MTWGKYRIASRTVWGGKGQTSKVQGEKAEKSIHDSTWSEVKDSNLTFPLLLANTCETFWQKPHFFFVLVQIKDASLPMFTDTPFTNVQKSQCGRFKSF